MEGILAERPDTKFHGAGGAKMQKIGGTKDWLEKAAVMGIVEVLKQYNWFKKQLRLMLEEIEENRVRGHNRLHSAVSMKSYKTIDFLLQMGFDLEEEDEMVLPSSENAFNN